MEPLATGEITRQLAEWGKGNREALEQFIPVVYGELHKIAKRCMAGQNPDHTLQTTAVIHEAYLKLVATPKSGWQNRAHFFAVAAKAMRHVLVDHARAKNAARRGGRTCVLRLEDGLNIGDGPSDDDLIALDHALKTLAELHDRQSEVVELRYFGGLSVNETAAALHVSPETVMRDWKLAKAFLYREMRRDTGVEAKGTGR